MEETTTMYLTSEGVDEVRKIVSYPEMHSVLLHLSDQIGGRRKVVVKHVQGLTEKLNEINDKYGGVDDGAFEALDDVEKKQKTVVVACKKRHADVFPRAPEEITPAIQANILRMTNIRTGAFLLYTGEQNPTALFRAFRDLMAALNKKDNAGLPSDIYANVEYYPNDPKLSRIQVVCHSEGSHGRVLEVIQNALQFPLTIMFKFDAMRLAGYRLRSEDVNLTAMKRDIMATRGIINQNAGDLLAPIDHILQLSMQP